MIRHNDIYFSSRYWIRWVENIYSALLDKPKQDKIPFVKWLHELKLVAKALILKVLE